MVLEISDKAFAVQRTVFVVLQFNHVTHLWGIYPLDWQTKPCKRAVKSVGTEYVDLACRGVMFVPQDCASWLLRRDADGHVNVFELSKGLFPLLTGREPRFKEALDWLQFLYTAERASAYVAPASTVLTKSAVEVGGELFPEIMVHLRRQYPDMYGLAVAMGRMTKFREIKIGEGGGLSGRTIVHSSIKLGAYSGRFTNLILAGMNKPSPNLTTVYIDIPLVRLTPEPLEYAPFSRPPWAS